MHHGPAVTLGKDYAAKQKSKLGLILFAVYSLVYSGFVFINTFYPKLMGTILFAGLNFAVIYGIGLIVFAIVLGLIYNHMCTQMENEMEALNAEEVKS